MKLTSVLVVATTASVCTAFSVAPHKASLGSIRRFMSEDSPVKEEADSVEDPKLFDMNRIVRLGRSRDQDGKSNIWSIEPKMEGNL